MPNLGPTVIPMIAYKDGFAALDWLARAFGFRERARMAGPDGRLAHGEMEAGDGLIMLATPSPAYRRTAEASRIVQSGPGMVHSALGDRRRARVRA